LKALIAKGAVKIENFKNNQNKWAYSYFLTSQGIAEKTALTGSFLKRRMQEYEQLKQEIESLTQEAQIVKEAEAVKKLLKKKHPKLGLERVSMDNPLKGIRFSNVIDRALAGLFL
jgi:hypothetical protein